jgi:hypothetical protein
LAADALWNELIFGDLSAYTPALVSQGEISIEQEMDLRGLLRGAVVGSPIYDGLPAEEKARLRAAVDAVAIPRVSSPPAF